MNRTLGEGCEEIFTIANIDSKVRPQDLTVAQWCTLAKTYENWLKTHPEQLKIFQQNMKSKGDSRDMLAMAQRLLDDVESKNVDKS